MDNINNSNKLLINNFLIGLIGEICWSVTAGSGTGSMVLIDFGDKIKREHPLKNPALTLIEREFYGQFGIYIQEANWLLKKGMEVVCTNQDNNENEGLMVSSLKKLIGKQINSVDLSDQNYNFKLNFSDEICLEIICIYKSNEYFDNYSLHNLEKIVSVSADGQVLVEKV